MEPVVRCVVVVAGKTRLGKRGEEDGFVVEEPVGDGWGRRRKVALGEDDSTACRYFQQRRRWYRWVLPAGNDGVEHVGRGGD